MSRTLAVAIPSTQLLDPARESFLQGQLRTGRYKDAAEVVSDAVAHMERREQSFALLDASLVEGLADIDAGRVVDADTVFDARIASYALPKEG